MQPHEPLRHAQHDLHVLHCVDCCHAVLGGLAHRKGRTYTDNSTPSKAANSDKFLPVFFSLTRQTPTDKGK